MRRQRILQPRIWIVAGVLFCCSREAFAQTGRPAYMRKHNLIVCLCPKCGSTSFYNWLYSITNSGSKWQYVGAPWIQQLYSPRWHDAFVPVHALNRVEQEQIFSDPNTIRLAVVRDPLERLVSAWRSKVMCEGRKSTGTDTWERASITRSILRLLPDGGIIKSKLPALANKTLDFSDGRDCLYLNELADVLAAIHAINRDNILEPHFRPQQHHCFREYSVSKWNNVVYVDKLANHSVLNEIYNRTIVGSGNNVSFEQLPHVHSTVGIQLEDMRKIYPESLDLLSRVVEEELRNLQVE